MTRTTTYSITVGLESPELTVDQCRAFAFIAAGKYFPAGHTIVEATGRWTSDRGVIDEPSLIITVIVKMSTMLSRFVTDYKRGCFQDCVLIRHPSRHFLGLSRNTYCALTPDRLS